MGEAPSMSAQVPGPKRSRRPFRSIEDGEYFTRTRNRIREALRTDGIAGKIDKLINRLLR